MNDGIEARIVLGGGGGFESEGGLEEAFRERCGVGEEICGLREIVVGHRLERWSNEVQGRQVAGEGVEEFGDTEMADLLKNTWLDEQFNFGIHMFLVFRSRLQKG